MSDGNKGMTFYSIMFGISFLFTMFGVGYFLYRSEVASATTVIGAGFLLMAFANLDKFARFKGAGFEAEMRSIVREGHVTLEKHRELALNFAAIILSTVSAGKFTGVNIFQRLDFRRQLVADLERLEVSSESICRATEKFDDYIRHDHALKVVVPTFSLKDLDDTNKEEIMSLIRDRESIPSSAVGNFREVVERAGIELPEVREAIEDLEYYDKEKKLRRPEVWYPRNKERDGE